MRLFSILFATLVITSDAVTSELYTKWMGKFKNALQLSEHAQKNLQIVFNTMKMLVSCQLLCLVCYVSAPGVVISLIQAGFSPLEL